jgi:peptidoglycan/xylan/chitin deacetylase (PgdA/CDA1 family)
MYHSVSDQVLDPWGTSVSPAHFAQHLGVLRQERHPLALIDFVNRFRAGTLPADAVAVTFDDGYADNLIVAKPLLVEARIPATVFLATGYLQQAGEFWWDELTRLILLASGPCRFSLKMADEERKFEIEPFDPSDGRNRAWRAWLDAPRTGRQVAYIVIWKYLRTASGEERRSVMDRLRQLFVPPMPQRAELRRPMTPEEVRALVEDDLISIEPHTVTHPPLTEVDPSSVRREIFASRSECELLTGRKVHAFAYPFGSFDSEIRSTVAAADFICACSTRHAPITAKTDLFALPRIHVLNEGGDALARSLHHATFAHG